MGDWTLGVDGSDPTAWAAARYTSDGQLELQTVALTGWDRLRLRIWSDGRAAEAQFDRATATWSAWLSGGWPHVGALDTSSLLLGLITQRIWANPFLPHFPAPPPPTCRFTLDDVQSMRWNPDLRRQPITEVLKDAGIVDDSLTITYRHP